MNKNIVRIDALEKRKNKDNIKSSNKVVLDLINSKILDNHKNIGIYYPIGKEISLLGLLEHYKDKNFYLPITRDEISFIKYSLGDNLVDAKFHTKEPIGDITKRDSITCFLIPCVAVSNDLKRIGYGKGYYDRYLKGYNGLKIGICYSDCIYDIELDSYDIKLDLVIKG